MKGMGRETGLMKQPPWRGLSGRTQWGERVPVKAGSWLMERINCENLGQFCFHCCRSLDSLIVQKNLAWGPSTKSPSGTIRNRVLYRSSPSKQILYKSLTNPYSKKNHRRRNLTDLSGVDWILHVASWLWHTAKPPNRQTAKPSQLLFLTWCSTYTLVWLVVIHSDAFMIVITDRLTELKNQFI